MKGPVASKWRDLTMLLAGSTCFSKKPGNTKERHKQLHLRAVAVGKQLRQLFPLQYIYEKQAKKSVCSRYNKNY